VSNLEELETRFAMDPLMKTGALTLPKALCLTKIASKSFLPGNSSRLLPNDAVVCITFKACVFSSRTRCRSCAFLIVGPGRWSYVYIDIYIYLGPGRWSYTYLDQAGCYTYTWVRAGGHTQAMSALASSHPRHHCGATSIEKRLFRVWQPPASTLHHQPSTLNPQPSTFNPHPSSLNPQPSTLNPQPSTLNPQPSTLNPQPSTLNP